MSLLVSAAEEIGAETEPLLSDSSVSSSPTRHWDPDNVRLQILERDRSLFVRLQMIHGPNDPIFAQIDSAVNECLGALRLLLASTNFDIDIHIQGPGASNDHALTSNRRPHVAVTVGRIMRNKQKDPVGRVPLVRHERDQKLSQRTMKLDSSGSILSVEANPALIQEEVISIKEALLSAIARVQSSI